MPSRTPQFPLHANRANRAGFTVLELLVVIGIIGLLAGAFAVALWGAMDKAPQANTKAVIQQVMAGLEAYKSKAGYFPPDVPAPGGATDTDTTMPGSIDSSAEAIYYYLVVRWQVLNQDEIAQYTTDKDNDTFREFVDGWGNPLEYLSPDQLLPYGAPASAERAAWDADRASFNHTAVTSPEGFTGSDNRTTYDLWSVGPDGIDGNADDVCNWFPKQLN